MSFLSSDPSSQALSERRRPGQGEVSKVHRVELSSPSPLWLLSYYTIVGAPRITKLHKAWSFLTRGRGSIRGEKMYRCVEDELGVMSALREEGGITSTQGI